MSAEFWTAFGSLGTFVVIAATGVIAMVQLRHLRAANQALVMHNLFNEYEGPEYRDAFHFVRVDLANRLADPDFRRELRSGVTDRVKHPEIIILNFMEQMAALYRYGAMDRAIFLQSFSTVVVGFWDRLEPVIALMADPTHGNLIFQHFESMALDARRWVREHPHGKFALGAERIALVDRWRDADIS